VKKLLNIKNEKDWEDVKDLTLNNYKVVIFKYSPICYTSTVVEKDFDSWYSKVSESANLCVAKVNVISEREISQLISKELNVLHQSPQAIWLAGTKEAKWDASHYEISDSKLDELLAE